MRVEGQADPSLPFALRAAFKYSAHWPLLSLERSGSSTSIGLLQRPRGVVDIEE